MNREAEIEAITNAIDDLVSAALVQPAQDDRPEDEGLGVVVERVEDTRRAGPTAHAARELCRAPLRMAMLLAIDTLGQRLLELGGKPLVYQATNNILDRHPESEEQREWLLASRWREIGA